MNASLPLPPNRDEFNRTVWDIARLIPTGRVATYGQIALLIPVPEDQKAWRARWVGQAMAACPRDVPWQRVINSQGKISPRGPGSDRQRALLEGEGVSFDARGRVDLARFSWAGPDQDWLSAHGLSDNPSGMTSQERLL